MTMDDRIGAVARLGFTERQARFLVHVMLFSGICLPRQYARSAGTAYGHNVTEFFARLVRDGHATAWRSLHNRGRLYHVRGRRLYEAIGEPRHRHRCAVAARQVTERLMRLDALLAEPTVRWLACDAEKIAYMQSLAPSLSAERLPHVVTGVAARRPVRLFADGILLGAGQSAPTFVHVVMSSAEEEWRRMLARYSDVLAALPRWVFRVYFPPDLEPWMSRFHLAFRDELSGPLAPNPSSDMRWYFAQLRSRTAGLKPREKERFRNCEVQLMITPRFRVLHERWLVDREAAFEESSLRIVAEQLRNQTGRVNCVLLPIGYRHLAPVVNHSIPASTSGGVPSPGCSTSAEL